jgi:hypothetical protein
MNIFKLTSPKAFILYIIINLLCTGAGMGIPIFNIGFGLLVGWYLIRRNLLDTKESNILLQKLMITGFITSMVTFIFMLLIWGWSISFLWGASERIINFGIPMLLFQPQASLIGWLLLMVIISPFIQFLLTIFSGHLTLLLHYKKSNHGLTSGSS